MPKLMHRTVNLMNYSLLSASLALTYPVQAAIHTCTKHAQPVPYFALLDEPCPECDKPTHRDALKISTSVHDWNKNALQIFSKLRKESRENQLVSSHSINEMLTMLAAGSAGKTLTSTTQIMGTTPEKLRDFTELLKTEDSPYAPPEKDDVFTRYNVVMVAKRHQLTKRYSHYLQHHFDKQVDIRPGVRFTDQTVIHELADSVNNKACDVTGGLIQTCLDPDELQKIDPALVLANATYFEGKWEVEFARHEGLFQKDDDTWSTASMVEASSLKISHVQSEGWVAVTIPYHGRFEMTLILPPKDKSPGELTYEQLSTLRMALKHSRPKIVTIEMPEYMFNVSYKLHDVFATPEPGNMFNDGADFSEMVENPTIHVSSMTHLAAIITDKEGTKAAALSDTVLTDGASSSEVITFSRPFLFMINDKEHKTVRFIGQLYDPGNYQPQESLERVE